jgi:tetratricopeptide (TPR) repeat protein
MVKAADPKIVELAADRLLSSLKQPGAVVWVQSDPAAPISDLIERVCGELKGPVLVEPPPVNDADAALHALLQATAPLGRATIEAALSAGSLHDAAFLTGTRLADSDRVLLLRLPASWEIMARSDSPDRELFHERALSVLQGLRDASTLRLALFSSRAAEAVLRRLALGRATPTIRLGPAEPPEGAFDAPLRWGAYDHAARKVRDALTKKPARLNRTQLGLVVGLVAWGDDAEALVSQLTTLEGGASLDSLGQRFAALLARADAAPLRDGLLRYAHARYPLKTEDALAIAALPPEHAPFLTECAGSLVNGHVRLDEFIRAALTVPSTQGDAETRYRLGQRYQAMDGEAHPAATTGATMLPWLEKTHQFGHAGELGAEAWSKIELPAREFYWDRARSLSIEHKRYLEAAEVYRACAERFPDDDYAWHYYAWNLDKVGRRAGEVEKGFRQAVAQNESNRWWNSRLVTFLIGQGRFQDAERAWRDALDRLDPSRVFIRQDEALSCNVHRWIVEEWLEAAEVARARRVFDQIPRELVERIPELAVLEWRLLDAEEAVALGESVYPAGMPMEDRWRKPARVPEEGPGGARLTGWYPGAVVSASEEGVALVFATTEEDISERRVIRVELSADGWRERADFCAPEEAQGFVVLATYSEGDGDEGVKEKLYAIDASPAPWEKHPRSAHERTRYLRSWADPEIGHAG